MNEQVVTISQYIFAAIVIIGVFVVMAATMCFHALNQDFSQQTISLLKWLIKVLVGLFFAFISVPGLRWIAAFLK